jgi:hypothetical protein
MLPNCVQIPSKEETHSCLRSLVDRDPTNVEYLKIVNFNFLIYLGREIHSFWGDGSPLIFLRAMSPYKSSSIPKNEIMDCWNFAIRSCVNPPLAISPGFSVISVESTSFGACFNQIHIKNKISTTIHAKFWFASIA